MAVAALQAAFEEGERGDWEAYVLRRPSRRRAIEMRPAVAQLAAAIPELALRAEVLAIDAETAELAACAEATEERGADPHDALVELFARKELLAREAGHAGYAQLALAADGLTTEIVEDELSEAARVADGDDVGEPIDAAGALEWFHAFFAPLLDGVDARVAPDALVEGMVKILRWPDRIGVVVRDAHDGRTMAHELGHALQCRARAERGLGFLDWYSLACVDAETAANVGERLLFRQPGLDPRHIGRARLELRMYAAALDEPARLDAVEGWSRDGHGFYTEDPMYRYAYPLAYVRSARILASLPRPLTADAVTAVL